MMERLENLMRSGIQSVEDYQTKRSILILNYICVVNAVLNFIVFLFRTFYFEIPALDVLVGTLFILLPIALNQFGLTNFSRLYFCYFGPVYLIYLLPAMVKAADPGLADGFRIYILALSIAPYMMFTRSEWPMLVLGVLPTFLSIVLFPQLIRVLAGESLAESAFAYNLMYMRSVVGYLIIGAGAFIFNSIITDGDARMRQMIQLLREKNNLIAAKNTELEDKRYRLAELNSHLEEMVDQKASDIRRQNEVLMRYAYTNAHKVRGPLARILGLINLSRMENSPGYPWIFRQLEHEAVTMDRIVSEISNDLHVASGEADDRGNVVKKAENVPE